MRLPGLGSGERISPTAHYTGQVWARNGLSHPALETMEGRLMFESVRPAMLVSSVLGGPTLERYLLARHRAIDALLERTVERDGVSQVLEVACGMSPRGWRFAKRFGSRLTYIEADLPAMAARKRDALRRAGSLSEHHQVREIDALADSGEHSIASLADSLDPSRGLAIVTEGLLGYLDHGAVAAIWRRFAQTLSGFSPGRYISDLHLGELQSPEIRAFRVALSAFVRGRVHLHFHDTAEAESALRAAGFDSIEVHRAFEVAGLPPGAGGSLAHILEASTVSR